MTRFLIASATLAASTGAAFAHPGEHAFSLLNSIAHLLTEPDHLAMIIGAIVIVGVLFRVRSRRSA